jgi:Flp pilus assembly pilin Flp
MQDLLERLLVEEEGQGITEYALILGLVVFGIWFAVSQTTIGTTLATLFTEIVTTIDTCSEGNCGGTGATP